MLTVVSIVTVAVTPAEPPAPPALAAGNKDDGHIKVYTCSGCHGIPGYRNAAPNYPVPCPLAVTQPTAQPVTRPL